MLLPVVAIVGRPNVGKSSLFNALAGRRISIVEPTAGVTRDRVSTVAEAGGSYFELVDTGGYGIEDIDDLTEHVEGQINLALERAQLVLFLVDVRSGRLPLDEKMAQLLRRREVPVLLVANKADSLQMEPQAGEFFGLGFGEPQCISAQHGRNLGELLERIGDGLEETGGERPADPVMHLAVVGKRNVGKSTFINSLAGEPRVIVSEVAGTTRDAVDVRFEKDGKTFVAIDTAGVRKAGKVTQNSIEFYSYTRALASIRRADVVLFFLDATADVSQVDKKLARAIVEQYKPVVLVVNKWDLAKDMATTDDYRAYLDKMLTGLSYAPISFITAKDGKNMQSLLDLASELHKQAGTELSTGRLNRVLRAITEERAPSARRKVGKPKIYYGTQVGTRPPTVLLFVNNPQSLDTNYQRYLVNRFRDTLPFPEVPIRLLLRHHRQGGADAEGEGGKGKGKGKG